jgi:SAM-dependent methyltransferase
MSWREFWNRETNSIYVNARHSALHDELIAAGVSALIDRPDAVVLDYGCGDASEADVVADKCARLFLYDAAPNVRARVSRRFADRPTIAVIDDETLTPIADGSLDLIVIVSVLQYVSRPDFEGLLDRFRGKLKPGGKLALADIISPDTGALDDARALLAFAWRGGFFLAALGGLARTFFSDYRSLRAQYGLTRYREAEMIALLAQHGFAGERAAKNIGHNQARMLFVARPQSDLRPGA